MARLGYTVEQQDALGAVCTLLQGVWKAANLDGFYLPVWDEGASLPQSRLLDSPDDLVSADLFAPIMLQNTAPQALRMLRENAQRRIGVFLRPCEWRTYRKLTADRELISHQAFTLCADCTGVMPVEAFEQQASDPRTLSRRVLHFAAQGGILPSRQEASCQLCDDPLPDKVDLHIELFGLATDEMFGVHLCDDSIARALSTNLGLEVLAESGERREKVLGDLARWRLRTLERLQSQLGEDLISITGLITHLQACAQCRRTLVDQCPLIEAALITEPFTSDPADFLAWVASCSGCGVCDQSCPAGYPLFDVIYAIRAQYTDAPLTY